MSPTVAIIGRPNTGKSTLFNRLIRTSKALIHDTPGVTRDRIYGEVKGDPPFALVDTGGLVLEGEGIEAQTLEQAKEAIRDAHLVLFMVDAKEGLTHLDEQIAEYLRKSSRPVLVAVNKIDGPEQEALAAEFHALGFDVESVSAAHGYRVPELTRRLREILEEAGFAAAAREPDREGQGLRIAMLGRPNAGKSSIINALLGKNRLIVSETPGTTRDAVDVTFDKEGKRYTFVDTAGVRRKGRIDDQLERFSVLRSLRSSKGAHAAVLVIDAEDGVTHQDKRLLAFLEREKVPFMTAVNKMDLIAKRDSKTVRADFESELKICPYAPVLFTSTVTKAGLGAILPMAEQIAGECKKKVSTGELNRVLRAIIDRHQPPLVKHRRAKFYYLTQVGVEPPTFIFFVNDPALVKPAYTRYLEKGLRKALGIRYAPVRVLYRSSHEDGKDRRKR